MSITKRLAIVGAVVLVTGCTTIGMHVDTEIDFGPPDTVRLCAYMDGGIVPDDAQALLDEAWKDEAPRYRLDFRIVRWYSWARPAYTYVGIMDIFMRAPVKPPCDRNIYFVNRHFGDALYGLVMLALPLPEIMGGVDDATGQYIVVVARRATLAQLLVLSPPATLRHELEHALGCTHGVTMTGCYETIARMKALHTNKAAMFPTRAADGTIRTEWRE